MSFRITAARRAVAAAFFVNGAVFATWAARIPSIKENLALNDSQLGLALLCIGIGALVAFSMTGRLIARFGSRVVMTAAGLGLCVTLPLLALAPSMAMLFAALVAFGLCNGGMDVAMNAHGVGVEQEYGQPTMSFFHGMFSLGGLAGAATGALNAALDITPLLHFSGVAACMACIVAGCTPHLLPRIEAERNAGSTLAAPDRRLLGLGAIAFCAFLTEGAMADWSGVYLRETLATDAAFAAFGYTAFSLTMTCTRFTGDRLVRRMGAETIVRLGGLLSCVGLAIGLAIPLPTVALLGFACVGGGMAIISPVVFGAAGNMKGMAAGTAIGAVATMGYSGFLIGPPLIGFLAHDFGMRLALGFAALLGLAIALLSRQVAR
jgi:MFS family permease